MIKEGKIGVQEAICLLVITISSKVFYSSPATLAGIVGNTGWYVTLIAALTALIGFLFIYILLLRFPGKDIIDVFEITCGRMIGFMLSGIVLAYLLFSSITRLAEFSEVIKVYVFPLSPNWYINVISVLCVVILSILGLENIARVTKLFVYIMLAGFVALLLLGIQNYDANNIFPIWGFGLGKTILQGLLRSSVYGEVILLAVFANSFQGIQHIKKEGIISILLSALIVSASLFFINLEFPYYITRNITSPMYEMSTLIDYGRFLQRVEPVFLFVWILSTLISETVVFYAFIWIYCKMFRIQDKKPILLGCGIILFAASLMHDDIITVISGYIQWTRDYGSLVVFILPLLALIISILRKKGEKPNANA